jgi:hypothetical protein
MPLRLGRKRTPDLLDHRPDAASATVANTDPVNLARA